MTPDKIINTSSTSTDSSTDSGSEHASDSDTNLVAAFFHKDTSRKNKNKNSSITPSMKRKRKSCIGFIRNRVKPCVSIRYILIIIN